MAMIFSEQTMIEGNLFKFEDKLKSQLNRYTEGGMLLTTYWSLREEATTVDRGSQDIEELFGKRSPLRYDKIENFPLQGSNPLTPENGEDNNIEDFNVDGEYIIIPGMIVPKVCDCFMINHLKMKALFIVTSVSYDTMKVNGNYKITYRLQSTSEKIIEQLEAQTLSVNYTDLNAIGTNVNPIIKKDDFILRSKIEKMTIKMIEAYKAMFYNKRHNCFLYHDKKTNMRYFDTCGNEFMAKHGLMNAKNVIEVISLHAKLRDPDFPIHYNNSIYNWLELDAPERMLQKFHYVLYTSTGYPESSFAQWGDDDIEIMIPLAVNKVGKNNIMSYFDEAQFNAFMDPNNIPDASEFDKLIWKYIHKSNTLSIHDISLYTADTLLSGMDNFDVFIYTPIVLYIIQQILQMN